MNMLMPEVYSEEWQNYVDPFNGQERMKHLVSICNLTQMNIIASKALLEGGLA
jgi:hypothetical protein